MDLAPGPAAADPPLQRSGRYVVAALTAAGGVLAAIAVLLWYLGPVGGDFDQRITPGRAFPVQVPEAGKLVGATSDDGLDLEDLRCEPSPADRQNLTGWSVVSMRYENLTVDVAGRPWHGALLVTADPPGVYSVTCTTPQATGSTELAVGEPPRFYGPHSRTVAVLGAIVLVSAGLLAGSLLFRGRGFDGSMEGYRSADRVSAGRPVPCPRTS